MDPKCAKAVHLAQYSTQYLMSCQQFLKERERTLQTAIDAYDSEEEALDLELTRLRYVYVKVTRNDLMVYSTCSTT